MSCIGILRTSKAVSDAAMRQEYRQVSAMPKAGWYGEEFC